MALDNTQTAALSPNELQQQTKALERRFRLGIFCVLLAAGLWGLTGSMGEILFTMGATPAWSVNVRLFVGGIAMIGIAAIKEKGKIFAPFTNKRDILGLIVFGVVGIMLCQFSYYETISLSNAATACVLQYLSPLFIIIWECFTQRRKPFMVEVIAVALALVGVYLIATQGNPTSLSLSLEALIWGVASSIGIAVYTIAPRRLLKKYSAFLVLGWGMFIGSIIMMPFSGAPFVSPALTPELILMITGIILLGTIFCFWLYMVGLSIIGSIKTGLLASVEPIVAAVIGVLFLGTFLTPAAVLGFVLVISTVFVTSLPLNRLIAPDRIRAKEILARVTVMPLPSKRSGRKLAQRKSHQHKSNERHDNEGWN